MTREEWLQYLTELFPATVGGMVRPTEPIPTDLDFSADFPQFIRTDPVLFTQENAFLRQLLSNDKLLKAWLDNLAAALAAQDFDIVTALRKGLMSPEMLAKLNGIEAQANKYVHPSSHPASMITQDSARRMVSDAKIADWDAKAGTAVVSTTADGLAPKRSGNAGHCLRGDGVWGALTAAQVGAAAAGHTHDDRYYTETEIANLLAPKAPLASPALTGTPTAPTAATGTNTLQIANTAFVQAAITSGGGGIVAASLAENGYVKFANGLILQWGYKAGRITKDGSVDVIFPIAFPQSAFHLSSTYIVTNATNDVGSGCVLKSNYTQTQATFIQDTYSGTGTGLFWLALGV